MPEEAFYRMEWQRVRRSRKSQIFSTNRVFNDPAEGVSLGIGYRRKTVMMGLPRCQESLKICLAVLAQYRHVTGGQTDTAGRQRPRYAERRAGKNNHLCCPVSAGY